MKTCLTSLIYLLILIPGAMGQAAQTDAIELWTSRAAIILNQVNSPQDLLKQPNLNETNQKSIQTAIQKYSKIKFIKPSIDLMDSTTIRLAIGKSESRLGFAQISKDKVFLNGREIQLAANKTFLNYQIEVDRAFETNSNASLFHDLFLPSAQAAEQNSALVWMKTQISTFLVGSSYSILVGKGRPSLNVFPDEALIRAYRGQIDSMFRSQKEVESTVVFECDGPKLKSVRYASLEILPDGLVKLGPSEAATEGWHIQADPQGRLLHSYFRERVLATTDGTAIKSWVEDKKKDASKEKNIFDREPFFRFPKFAQACCQQKGCYGKVTQDLKRLQEPQAEANAPASAQ